MPTITGNNSIDSLLAGPDNRWNKGSAYGTAVNVSFSFAKTLPAYADPEDPENKGFSVFNAEQQPRCIRFPRVTTTVVTSTSTVKFRRTSPI